MLSDGTRYSGDWKDDLQEGQGEEILPDGTIYSGQFKEGEKSGKGIVRWPDGSYYDGDFENNVIHGKGAYNWADGRVYVGMWQNGKINGKGKFTWPDGKTYEGEYKNDKKDGFGRYTVDGKAYEGTWFNGKQNGYGAYIVNNEVIMKGFWRYGKVIKRDWEKKDNIDTFSVGTNGNVDVKTFGTSDKNGDVLTNFEKKNENLEEAPASDANQAFGDKKSESVKGKKSDENKENIANSNLANGNH